MTQLAPRLTPCGHLHLEASTEGALLAPDVTGRLEAAFARGAGHGLLQLGAAEVATPLPPALRYWRDFAARYARNTGLRIAGRSRTLKIEHQSFDFQARCRRYRRYFRSAHQMIFAKDLEFFNGRLK